MGTGLAALLLGLTFAQTTPAGTAQLVGRVVIADETAVPVRRATVTISGDGLTLSRTAITDDNGGFAFDRLPAGHFTLTASRPAFLTSSYGSKGPGRPGTAVTVAAGQRLVDLTIRLPRGAVIAGAVHDEEGAPLANVLIALVRTNTSNPPAAGPTDIVTNDRGEYRVYGLEPGSYLVAAAVRFGPNQIERLTSEEMDAALQEAQRTSARPGTASAMDRPGTASAAPARPRAPYGYAPIFYPGTGNASQAIPATVAAGQERSGLDITLTAIRLAVIEGVVTNPNGPLPAVQLSFASATSIPLPPLFGTQPQLTVRPGSDGRFRYEGVAPGTYTISARSTAPSPAVTSNVLITNVTMAQPSAPGSPAILWGAADVQVGSDDVAGVALSLQPGLRINGRIAFDGTTTLPSDMTTLRLNLQVPNQTGFSSVNGTNLGRTPPPGAAVKADGTFEFPSVFPGVYQFSGVVPNSSAWRIRSAIINGKDALDVPLEIPATSGDVTGAVVTFTDRHTELSGMLHTAAGAPAADYVVVLFSTDRATWRPQARRLLFTRPASDGAYTLRDMPPGSYYLAALTDLDPNDWQNAAFLDQVVPGALTVTIGEGEQKTQDLRLAR